jgi:hypothetical protein
MALVPPEGREPVAQNPVEAVDMVLPGRDVPTIHVEQAALHMANPNWICYFMVLEAGQLVMETQAGRAVE